MCSSSYRVSLCKWPWGPMLAWDGSLLGDCELISARAAALARDFARDRVGLIKYILANCCPEKCHYAHPCFIESSSSLITTLPTYCLPTYLY